MSSKMVLVAAQLSRSTAECDTLKAERDGLLAEVEQLKRWQATVRENSPLLIQLDALQSELTKARESADLLQFWSDHPEYVGGFAPSGDWSFFNKGGKTCYGKTLNEALAKLQIMHADINQSAPAAKGDSDA